MIINKSSKYNNVVFKEKVIIVNYIYDKINVEFSQCVFYSVDKFEAIYLQSRQNIYLTITKCVFRGYDNTIEVNDNYLQEVSFNDFQFCHIGLSMKNEKSILDFNNIYDNYMICKDEDRFINIVDSEKNLVHGSRMLYLNNNQSRIVVNGIMKIDTKAYYALNNMEVQKILETCENGAMIYVNKGIIFGNVSINKQVALIGKYPCILIPNPLIDMKAQSGIVVNADNVYIKNFIIDGGTNFAFMDGIKFSSIGSEKTTIENCTIKRIYRRGISLWGKNTKDTVINNCKISYIEKQCGIHLWNYGEVNRCFFRNMHVGILIKKNIGGKIIENKFFLVKSPFELSDINKRCDDLILYRNVCNNTEA